MIIVTYVGVDPGGTTGLVFADVYAAGQVTHEGVELAPEDVGPYYRDRLDQVPRTARLIVARERFIITPGTAKKTSQQEALLVSGTVDEEARTRRPDALIIAQNAGDAKKLVTNERLRTAGWYLRGRRHANDASRHALLAMAVHHNSIFIRLIKYGSMNT